MTPFQPTDDATLAVSASTTTANGALKKLPKQGRAQIRVTNDATATAYVRFGLDSTVTATAATGVPIPAGAVEVLTVDVAAVQYAAVLLASGTGSVYFNTGDGV